MDNLSEQVDLLPGPSVDSENQSSSNLSSCEKSCKKPTLPPAPIPPEPSDCCGSGCVPCVLDIYDQEVAIWKRQCEKITCGDDGKVRLGFTK